MRFPLCLLFFRLNAHNSVSLHMAGSSVPSWCLWLFCWMKSSLLNSRVVIRLFAFFLLLESWTPSRGHHSHGRPMVTGAKSLLSISAAESVVDSQDPSTDPQALFFHQHDWREDHLSPIPLIIAPKTVQSCLICSRSLHQLHCCLCGRVAGPTVGQTASISQQHPGLKPQASSKPP